jgi:mersacidin/lichenicidin family type 2 lantibiotic
MSHINILRAWKDDAYRLSLTEAERTQVPQRPEGLTELTEGEMSRLGGGCCEMDTGCDFEYEF